MHPDQSGTHRPFWPVQQVDCCFGREGADGRETVFPADSTFAAGVLPIPSFRQYFVNFLIVAGSLLLRCHKKQSILSCLQSLFRRTARCKTAKSRPFRYGKISQDSTRRGRCRPFVLMCIELYDFLFDSCCFNQLCCAGSTASHV